MRFVGALLCRFGHRPSPDSRWNEGYGFTTCERCGVVLVRSLLGGWHVPARHRVVWRPRIAEATTTPFPPAAMEDDEESVRSSPFDFSAFDLPSPRCGHPADRTSGTRGAGEDSDDDEPFAKAG